MVANVAALFLDVSRAIPDREAVIWRGARLSYAGLADRSSRLARHLAGHGLGRHPGEPQPWEAGQDVALLLMTNCPEYLEATFGCLLARVAPANANYRYTATELGYLLTDSGARCVIAHQRYLPVLMEAIKLTDAAGQVRTVLIVPDGTQPAGSTPPAGTTLPPVAAYEQALAAAPETALPPGTADDLYILYTGGTTGWPKGVLWRQDDFLAGPLMMPDTGTIVSRAASERGARIRALPAAPLMHGAAHWNAVACLLSGGAVVLPDETDRLDADDVLDTVERERCTSLQIVGDAFARPLLAAQQHRPRDLSTLRFLISGGAALSDVLAQRWRELLPQATVIDVIGSSESGRQGATDAAARTGRFRARESTVVLADDRSHELAASEPGTGWLAVHGAIPRGYLGDRQRTLETFQVIGGRRYVVAGDRASLLADGTIQLHGRGAMTINTGGEKVAAEEVEDALKAHPAVWDVVVLGRPSERWGQEVVALIELDPSQAVPTDGDLLATCARRLARYKLPKAILRVDQVERTAAGKPVYAWARRVALPGIDPAPDPEPAPEPAPEPDPATAGPGLSPAGGR